MQITPIKTNVVKPGTITLLQLVDSAVAECAEGSVLAITSKIVSLCEGRVVPRDGTDLTKLVMQESDYYLPAELMGHGYYLSIANNTLTPMAGIDESNGDGNYVLWPTDCQATANLVRAHLAQRFGLQKVGVVITDSDCQPLRWGTTGVALAHSGFRALRDYRGNPDLFGRPYAVTQASISGGLAAAAVLAMGEGNEKTPLCLLSDLPFVVFEPNDPTEAELAGLRIDRHEDLFGPLLNAVKWEQGKR